MSSEPPTIGPRSTSREARSTASREARPISSPEARSVSPPERADPPRDEAPALDRKLIRPRLEQHLVRGARPAARRRPQPPEQTGLEASFYTQHASSHAVVAVTLEDGQVLHGVVEWSDRDCMSIRRKELPSIVVMKHVIVHVSPDVSREEGAARRG